MATHHRGPLPSYIVTAAATVLFLVFTPTPLEAGDPVGQFCGNSSNYYTANGAYHANIQRLAATLPTNASSSRKLFATATIGEVPDTVYALALCRGDADYSSCRACVAAAFPDAQLLCPYNRDVSVFYSFCVVRYSDQNFLTSSGSSDSGGASTLFLVNSENVSAPVKAFDAAVGILVNAVADYAAYNSSNRYGTAVEGFQTFDSKNPTIYGLAQCTPDMSPADCRSCLSGIIQARTQYFSGKPGGRILGVRCNYRYEQYHFYTGAPMLQLPEPPVGELMTPAPEVASQTLTTIRGQGSKRKVLIVLVVSITVFCAVVASCLLLIARLRKGYGKTKLQLRANLPRSSKTEAALKLWRIEENGSDFRLYDFSELAAATGGFSDGNRLGRGGFGPVYKGKLENDEEIAVKRLAAQSGQGLEEFKNEIQLIAKLQHTNLVRLLGCCVQEEEKMLVYEYMPNRSLDFFIFDPHRGALMDWTKRLRIIEGIAQGLLYLHKHSRVRIIHRDLKASNILLDEGLNPKISDFGMARIFASNMTVANTNRIVGTYGYMAPEYASEGIFSVRSDVFSFGVLLLEIVSGKRNSGHHHHYGDFINLLGYAWQLWREGREFELIDPMLGDSSDVTSILRCIKVALLCVQDNAIDRPRMTEVMEMLGHDGAVLRDPNQPPHFQLRVSQDDDEAGGEDQWEAETQPLSIGTFNTNGMTITTVEGR